MIRFLATAALLALASTALAHSWYPHECCHDQDCYPIKDDEVELLSSGAYLIKATREVFSPPGSTLSDKHFRYSPDGSFHRCSFGGSRDSTSICLFIPQPNS